MPTWDRQQTGIAGLEEDVKALYGWVRDQNTALKTWLQWELGKVTRIMATYQQAVDEAIEELDDLSAQLKAALAANDSSGVQAAADRLDAAVQALKNPAPATDPTPEPPAPVDTPSTPDAPAGTDTPSV